MNMTQNEKHPQLDIIVPVYNTARYLDQCIQSIVSQTFTDWRLFLVDDGSTDKSPQICDEWAKRDPRITVIHKPNSGQGDSRNVALERSTAEFVGFVDSDDWIEPDMYATLIDSIRRNNADIALCRHFSDTKKGSRANDAVGIDTGSTVVIEGDDVQRLIINDRIESYIWQMLFRRECLAYRMPNHVCFEDYAVLPHWFKDASRVAYTPRPLYHYRIRRSSAIHNNSPEKTFAFFKVEQQRFEFYKDTAMRDESARQMVVRGIHVAKHITRMKIPRSVIKGYLKQIKRQLGAISSTYTRQLSPKERLLYRLLLHHTPMFIAYQKTEKVVMAYKRSKKGKFYE